MVKITLLDGIKQLKVSDKKNEIGSKEEVLKKLTQ
jgi:hypothetical protein